MLPLQNKNLYDLNEDCLYKIIRRSCIQQIPSYNDEAKVILNLSIVCKCLFEKMQNNSIWIPICDRLCPIDGSFKKRFQVERNQRLQRFTYHPLKDLPFSLPSSHLFCMGSDKLAVAKNGNPIFIRDLKTNEQFEINGELNPESIAIHGNYLFCNDSHSKEQTSQITRVYDMVNKRWISTFSGLEIFTLCGNTLFKLNRASHRVEVCDIHTMLPSESRPLPQDVNILCIAASKEELFVGTQQGKIYVWNEETRSFLDYLEEPLKNPIEQLTISDNELLALHEKQINFLRKGKRSGACFTEGNQLVVSDKKLFLMGSSGNIRYWNLLKGYHTFPLDSIQDFKELSNRTCYATDGNVFIHDSEKNTIKKYDFLANYDDILTDMIQALPLCSSTKEKDFFLDRFITLPQSIKKQVSDELKEILNSQQAKALNIMLKLVEGDFRSRRDGWQDQLFDERTTIYNSLYEAIKPFENEFWQSSAVAVECYVAKGKFRSLTQEQRNEVYRELYEVMKPFSNDYWGCAEHAFHNQHGQSSTSQQRMNAIKNYFDKRSP